MQAIDQGQQARWRRALFRRYYAGRTFCTNLPDDCWKLPPGDSYDEGDTPRHYWPKRRWCGGPGGPRRVERGSGPAKYRVAPPAEHTSPVGGDSDPSGTSSDEDENDRDSSDSSNECEGQDFVNKDISAYFTADDTKNITLDEYYRPRGSRLSSFQLWDLRKRLVGAGKEGWKAFTVCVYASFDPEGRLDTLTNYTFLVPDVVDDEKER
ncbi:hypothetical protein HK405_004686, partial [Cladochytrium tenue]